MRAQPNTQYTQSISMQVLEALSRPKITDKDKAKIIAEGFAQVEKNYLNLDNVATKSDLKETELKLTEKIENVRKEIETVKLETKNLEIKLINEISQSNWKTIKWMIGLVIAIMIPIMTAIISLILIK